MLKKSFTFSLNFIKRLKSTNIRFQTEIKPKMINIKETGDKLSTIEITKQVQNLLEIIKSDITLKCQETDFIYRIKAYLQGSLDRNNLHVYIENRQIIIETRKDNKGITSFKTIDGSYIPVAERSMLYIRRAITIPSDVDEIAITSRSIGDIIDIDLPKLCWMNEESED